MYLQLAEPMEARSLINEGELSEELLLSGGFFKKIASEIKKAGEKVVQTVKKIGLAVPRNSYLALVSMNVHGLATHLDRAIEKDPAPIKRKWEQLGGNFDKLKGAVHSGRKKKQLFDGDTAVVLSENEDGSVRVQTLSDPATAGAIASATPIIVALAPLLKAFTKDPEQLKKIDALIDTAKSLSPGTAVDPTDPAHSHKFDTEPRSGGFFASIPTPVYYVAGAVAILLIVKSLSKK